jgi:CubicO group peptidase (beta-lactamase class C family)
MISRRDVPLALAAHGLTIWSGSAFGQTKGTERKKATPAPSPIKADERVNQTLAPIRDEHHIPGLIGAIVTGNRLAAIGACGIRKFGAPDPIGVTDQVHVGSCTKAMTATMIGTLIDEGKLSSGTTIREVFPKVAPKLHPDFQAVTLLQLLTHRAGLPANGPWSQLSGDTATEKRRDLLARMLGKAPRSRPGSTFTYSNVGYALAGLMAEQVTGESWEALMRRRLSCGWVVAKKSGGGGGRTLWHNGSNTSWYATISIAPARDFAILTATNQGGDAATKACDQAAAKLIELFVLLTPQQRQKR